MSDEDTAVKQEEQVQAPAVSAPAKETTSTSTQDQDGAQIAQQSGTGDDSSQATQQPEESAKEYSPVPYDRFSEVIQERNEYKSSLNEVKARLDAIERERSQPQQDEIQYDSKQIEELSKVVKKAGFVSQQEMLQKEMDFALEQWLSRGGNEKFRQENDPKDQSWNVLMKEMSFLKKASSGKELQILLDKAKNNLSAYEFRSAKEMAGKTLAQAHNLSVASVGGGTQSRQSTAEEQYTPEQAKFIDELDQEFEARYGKQKPGTLRV